MSQLACSVQNGRRESTTPNLMDKVVSITRWGALATSLIEQLIYCNVFFGGEQNFHTDGQVVPRGLSLNLLFREARSELAYFFCLAIKWQEAHWARFSQQGPTGTPA